jgi:hypothetical protein
LFKCVDDGGDGGLFLLFYLNHHFNIRGILQRSCQFSPLPQNLPPTTELIRYAGGGLHGVAVAILFVLWIFQQGEQLLHVGMDTSAIVRSCRSRKAGEVGAELLLWAIRWEWGGVASMEGLV